MNELSCVIVFLLCKNTVMIRARGEGPMNISYEAKMECGPRKTKYYSVQKNGVGKEFLFTWRDKTTRVGLSSLSSGQASFSSG